jgi:hypothetical protein
VRVRPYIFVNVRESGVVRVHEKVCSYAHNTAVRAATSTKSFPQLAQAERFNLKILVVGNYSLTWAEVAWALFLKKFNLHENAQIWLFLFQKSRVDKMG